MTRWFTGFAFVPGYWHIGWTAGYTPWERIFWLGPLGWMMRAT